MTFSEYRYLLLSDLYRYRRSISLRKLAYQVLFGEGGKYSFWFRTCTLLRSHKVLKFTLYPFAWLMLRRTMYRLGISIHPGTLMGPGFYIGHFGGIVVSARSQIGRNCNISQGVTIGKAHGGKHAGYPVIGDNVYIGPGAKIVGGITIGSNVAIGANCVVTKDTPDNAVVVGVPGEVISMGGSADQVNHTDYDRLLVRHQQHITKVRSG
ncbi:MAG: serine acetyltransferase [Hyphomicrobiales bacterium]|nr:MAG: serine acetyltransferase [Hyphomicrobiales bacterium]